MMDATAVVVAVALVMAAGLVGTILPAVPGLPLIWAGALGYGLSEDFGTEGVAAMTLITLFLVVGVVGKYVLAHRRARGSGAPKRSIIAGGVLGFIGFFVIPIVGFFIGAALGVLLAERRRVGNWSAAWMSTRGVIAAFGIGVLLEMAAGVAMIAAWLVWVWSSS
jgi:uncharacterized protein YqgC (DUF456 family)